MAIDVLGTLKQELTRLTSAKTEIDRQIAALETAIGALGGRPSSNGMPRRRPRMSAAARKAVGTRMKAYWAKRRAAVAKPTAAKQAAKSGKPARLSPKTTAKTAKPAASKPAGKGKEAAAKTA